MNIKQDVWDMHLNSFPKEEEILRPFLSGFDVTWGRRRIAYGTELSVYFLKPHDHTKETFGFEQELLLAYTQFSTIEPRTIQAIEQVLHDDPARGRVERLTYLLVSEMDDPAKWIEDYVSSNQETRLIAAFNAEELRRSVTNNWFVANTLRKQFYGRDLFDYRLPLEHDLYFFGREAEVLTYRDAVKRGENRGIFGLRKTGKTSLLFKIRRVLEAENLARVIYIDCKSPEIRSLSWIDLLCYICNEIVRHEVSIDGKFSPSQASKLFSSSIKDATKQKPLLLIFDEIEYITPISKLDMHWQNDFVPFWQTIWSTQSKHRRLSVIFAGVNPSVTEESVYNSVQNPLFGIVSSQYLTGLSLDETGRLVRTLGRRMGLKFEQASIDYLFERYGGHPLLTRIACSFLDRYINDVRLQRPVVVTKDILLTNDILRESDISFYCEHVVSELRQFYSYEYEMLELLARKSIADFTELAKDGSSVKHLRDYGLIKDISGFPVIAIPVVEKYLLSKAGGVYTVPVSLRSSWVKKRVECILRDLRQIELRLRVKLKPQIYGESSILEPDKLLSIDCCDSTEGFGHFINLMNRSFVEPLDIYGYNLGQKNYFWDLKQQFPNLHLALERIKVYRNNEMHIKLYPKVESRLCFFLDRDLPGIKIGDTDSWFILQQRCLDDLFAAIQCEAMQIG